MTISQAREMAFAEFPGLQELHFIEGPVMTVTVLAKPRKMEWGIKEHLRLQGAVFLHWKTGDDLRRQLAMSRILAA